MLMKLDFTCDVPIYRQIHDQIVVGIAGGAFHAGEKLPTIRALANETGVNVMTINKAYQLLKQEGHIITDRRGGTMVAGKTASVSCEKTLEELSMPVATAKLSGMTRNDWIKICEQAYDSLDK